MTWSLRLSASPFIKWKCSTNICTVWFHNDNWGDTGEKCFGNDKAVKEFYSGAPSLLIFIALCLGHGLTQRRCLTNVCWTSWNWSSAYVQNKQSWRSVSTVMFVLIMWFSRAWLYQSAAGPLSRLEDLLLARPALLSRVLSQLPQAGTRCQPARMGFSEPLLQAGMW